MASNRTTLEALRERVRKAEGPDREIDGRLQRYLLDGRSIHFGNGGLTNAFTASIDAAVALVERVLPGAVWHVMTDYGGLNRAKIGPAGRPQASVYRAGDYPAGDSFSQDDGETPPLAILGALLSALIEAHHE